MVEVPVYDPSGQEIEKIQVDKASLGGKVKRRLLKNALVYFENNRRGGNAHTQVRSEVTGSRAKMYRQKGTGSARHGSRQANLLRGGATQFGPRHRSFRTNFNRKARREAARTALLARMMDQEVCVVDGFSISSPKTKTMAELLKNLSVKSSCLFGLAEFDENILKSSRNIPGLRVEESRNLNAWDLTASRRVLFTREAFAQMLQGLAGQKAEE